MGGFYWEKGGGWERERERSWSSPGVWETRISSDRRANSFLIVSIWLLINLKVSYPREEFYFWGVVKRNYRRGAWFSGLSHLAWDSPGCRIN